MSHISNSTSSFSFVSGMVNLYYPSDRDMQEDLEIQAWFRDISEEGFTELPNFGLCIKKCFLYLNIQVKRFLVKQFLDCKH